MNPVIWDAIYAISALCIIACIVVIVYIAPKKEREVDASTRHELHMLDEIYGKRPREKPHE